MAKAGLGELLRHLTELTDGGSSAMYEALSFDYRPRYTPVMRALTGGPATVGELQRRLFVSQGAVSQTLKLMAQDGLVRKTKGDDGRESIVELSPAGRHALAALRPHWDVRFEAIEGLEAEIGLPLRVGLERAVSALQRRSFAKRIGEARRRPEALEPDPSDRYLGASGASYRAFRPTYPPEVALALAELVPRRSLAVDVGCGTGQLTRPLLEHFDHVVGLDPSASQLAEGETEAGLVFQLGSAEQLGLPDGVADLIVAAQAAHWFDLPAFYTEVRRVARPDAALALLTYGVPHLGGEADLVFQRGYWGALRKYWPTSRRHVENGYAELDFPFPAVRVPQFEVRKNMPLHDFVEYLRTWSAYRNACRQGASEAFEAFFEELSEVWPEGAPLLVVWRLSVRVGRIHGDA